MRARSAPLRFGHEQVAARFCADLYMRRPNRSVEMFSLSALDLFASAMGAFIIIAVIALPDYLNKTKVRAEVDALKVSVSELQQQKEAIQKELEEARTNALLGITTSAKSFVFLVDTSLSMVKFTERLAAISAQAIAGLQPDQSLQVIGFSNRGAADNLMPWRDPRSLQPMTDSSKLAAAKFIEQLATEFDGGTPTEEALMEALEYEAEAIVLVTDGAPNGIDVRSSSASADFAEFVGRVTAANTRNKEIHTIGIGDYTTDTKFRDFLKDLSAANAGQFLGF